MTLKDTVVVSGELRALETVEVRAEATAPVLEIHFEEGAEVRRGELLFTLDPAKLADRLDSATAALDAARARSRLARRTAERVRTLHERGSSSDEELDRADADRRQAAAEVRRLSAETELLREQIDDTTVLAPLDGRISERLVDAGDFVQVGDPLAVLYSADTLEVAAGVSEGYAGRIEPGQNLELRVAALPERSFSGDIGFVAPAIDPATRTFLVKGRVDDPEGVLKPGTFATVTITVRTLRDRPVVPEEALVSTRDGYVVFVIEDGTARRRDVKVGLRAPGEAEIRSGVEKGETVVRAGQMSLDDGARVEVVADVPEEGAGAEIPR